MSLVALDWMMSKAVEQGLRFSPFEREQYRSQQGFADKLYNPRSGLGIFYRWKPRNVTALCAEKGIAVPRIHASVIERIVQAPEGYAPGNVPPRCTVVTTEAHSLVDPRKISEAIAAAHGGTAARPLIEQQAAWVRVGFAAYLAFVIGIAGALIRALITSVGDVNALSEVVTSARPLFDVFPFSLLAAVLRDPIATTLLFSGLLLGYILSGISDRRTNWVYSAFWHRHRPALRTALRRTPAPVMTEMPAGAAPAETV